MIYDLLFFAFLLFVADQVDKSVPYFLSRYIFPPLSSVFAAHFAL